ncbi:HEPN domain-containing protein [Leptospira weilii]|uniref:HEPN domain-containing protein n=1 Tax=Leptospira weilii TaxID=28184 RepID=UPI000774DA33|nr:HEPN domain-containing protein [Leptospira weilii]
MITTNFEQIKKIIARFSGKNGEPIDEVEFYQLKSMWVMMVSEFEGVLKDGVEQYIDNIKLLPMEKIHICLLLQNFYGNSKELLNVSEILHVYKKDKAEITYKNFTKDQKPKNKSHSIESLFNSLGLFFSNEEIIMIKQIDGISSTRDSIAHGNTSINITKSELEKSMNKLAYAYDMLSQKLKNNT